MHTSTTTSADPDNGAATATATATASGASARVRQPVRRGGVGRPGTWITALGLVLGAWCLQGPTPAWAAKATVKAGTQSQAVSPATSVRFIDAPSSEKPAARERRLKRECKGRPNAGVCLGYTR
jgi:hypothetical protein